MRCSVRAALTLDDEDFENAYVAACAQYKVRDAELEKAKNARD